MVSEIHGRRPRLWATLRTPVRGARAPQPRNRRGFTLIELIVGLTVGTLVVLLAHQLFAALADRGRTLTAARAALDRSANANRWLTAAFLSLDVGPDSASGFDGRPDLASFSTWLLTPDGWFERRRVTLNEEGGLLEAHVIPGTPIVLKDSVGEVEFDYLLDPGADSRWIREWVSPVSAPVAVRMRIANVWNVVDTLLFLVRERG